MKTLRVELVDQAGDPVPGKVSVAYSWDVLMTDGSVFSSTPRTYYAPDGVFNIQILAADDPGIEPGYEAFTTRVSWSVIAPDCNGRMSEGKVNKKTIQVVLADPEPVSISDLDNVTPATMNGVWYGGGGGGGVELVSGVVDLDSTGSPVREFYCTASATIEGVAFAAGTAVVFRRTPAGVWGYIVVDPWTDISAATTTTTTVGATTTTTTAAATTTTTTAAATTTTTTAATTTTTTTAATTTTTTTAVPGTLTYQGHNKFAEVTTATWSAAPIGTASANREVIVMLTWSAGAARYPEIEINGTDATLDYEQGGYRQRGFRLYRMAVPTGTTADIVIPTTSSLFPTMAVWTVDQPVTFLGGTYYNEPSLGVTSVAVTSSSTVAGGFVLSGLSYYTNPNTPSTTWTNLTERWDAPGQTSTSGGDAATTGTSHTVTAEFSSATVQPATLAIGAYDWA